MSIKQDRCLPRTALDVDRRYNPIPKKMEQVEDIVREFEVDKILSASSSNAISNSAVTIALNNKVSKVAGKDLSTNDFTDEDKEKLSSIKENAQENVLEKIYISGEELTPTNKAVNIYVDSYTSRYSTNPVQNQAITTFVSERTGATTYGLSTYKVSDLSILRSSCVLKNNRVCISFVGTLSMNANTTTTLFNLPTDLRPTATKDFVVFGQSSNTDGYVGYGYITSDGLLQVRFNEDISSYIRFSVTYDLD